MDKLEEIMANKRRSLEHIVRPIKAKELEALARSKSPSISFFDALASPDRLSVIADKNENLLQQAILQKVWMQ